MNEEENNITVKDDELEVILDTDENKAEKQKTANRRAYEIRLQERYKTGKLEQDDLDEDLEELEDDPLYDADDIMEMFGDFEGDEYNE
jgi:hypothetical protein